MDSNPRVPEERVTNRGLAGQNIDFDNGQRGGVGETDEGVDAAAERRDAVAVDAWDVGLLANFLRTLVLPQEVRLPSLAQSPDPKVPTQLKIIITTRKCRIQFHGSRQNEPCWKRSSI